MPHVRTSGSAIRATARSKEGPAAATNFVKVDTSCITTFGVDLPQVFAALANGQWSIFRNGQTLLFGESGRKWFTENEPQLASPHLRDFYARNLHKRFPVIMNFYPEEWHLEMKRRYAGALGKSALDKLTSEFCFEADNLFSKRLAGETVDLYQSITRAVIRGQLRLFFDVTVDDNTLALLADYEDLFSLGLYADVRIQDSWYAQERFRQAEEAFLRLCHESGEVVREFGLLDSANASARRTLGAISHFYNLSVAGSTNVAKLVCQVVESAGQMGNRLDALIGSAGRELAASCLIKETLRLLPWTENQITQPFISRQSSTPLVLNAVRLPGNSQVHLLHCLEHVSEALFATPHRFFPERWELPNGQSTMLYTFGVGRRKCCGEALASIWLRVLLDEYLRQCRFESTEGIGYRPYNARIGEIAEFSFRGVFRDGPGINKR